MADLASKNAVVTCYSESEGVYSHQVRIVLAEKGIVAEVKEIDPSDPTDEFLVMNPSQQLPTLRDRDLVLYHAPVIMEYLDERFPHPPLLPVYPAERAKARLMLWHIYTDWLSLIPKIQSGCEKSKHVLIEGLMSIRVAFNGEQYFMNTDFSLIDCCLAALLWRLMEYKIVLPPQAFLIRNYAYRMFARPGFQKSLTATERGFAAIA
jgi:RNA polymerase-associated protein